MPEDDRFRPTELAFEVEEARRRNENAKLGTVVSTLTDAVASLGNFKTSMKKVERLDPERNRKNLIRHMASVDSIIYYLTDWTTDEEFGVDVVKRIKEYLVKIADSLEVLSSYPAVEKDSLLSEIKALVIKIREAAQDKTE